MGRRNRGRNGSQDARIAEIETRMEDAVSSGGGGGGLGARARPAAADGESLNDKVEKLDGWVTSMHDDTQIEERLDRIENILKGNSPTQPKREAINSKDRKPLLEHKAVQNIAKLGERNEQLKE